MASTNGKRASSSSSASRRTGLMPNADMPIDEIWREYELTRSDRLRNELAEHYWPVALRTAERVHRKFPSEVSLDEVTSSATLGMIRAIESFETARNVKFETFCSQHINGAIYDDLRTKDWVPRLARERAKRVERAREVLRNRLGRPATDKELQRELGVSDNEFVRIMRDARLVQMGSLDRPIRQQGADEGLCEIDILTDKAQETPLAAVQATDQLREMIRDLTRGERLIVILYYHEGMTMSEIGATLDLSESRVSQLHTAILKRLKSKLAQREVEA